MINDTIVTAGRVGCQGEIFRFVPLAFRLAAVLAVAACATTLQAQPGVEGDPLAAPDAVVRAGKARFTVLTDRMIRMEYAEDEVFEDRATTVFVNRRLPVPAFAVERTDEGCRIRTDRLELDYRGGAFAADTLAVRSRAADGFAWRYGQVDQGNLNGTTRTLDNVSSRTQLMRILEKGILSREGWSVVDDAKSCVFEPTDDHWQRWIAPRCQTTRQDLYFFGYGHDYKGALGDYVKVAGRIPLPPRFAFGYWWSRYWPYSDNEVEELVATIQDFGLPMDVMIIDMDWHKTLGIGRTGAFDEAGQRLGWTGYTWEKGLFPDPEGLLERLHRRGLKVALNLHPAGGIYPTEDIYDDFRTAYGWTGTNAVPYRLSERKWADLWYSMALGGLERQGVDFWWLDWQQWLVSRHVPDLSNTFWLNHTMAHHESEKTDEKGRALRPLIYHRWGGLGSHRYQAGFSGDTCCTWDVLNLIPYFTATSGNVGYGYWGHDIGGHMGNRLGRDPEIFTRWLQGGVFTPLFRTHSTCSPSFERRIWMYPDHFATMRETFRLRYRLAPYIYTNARAAYDTGLSLCRPMYWDNPEDDEAYSPLLTQVRFGESIVAATVTEPTDPGTGLAKVRVWLPNGSDGKALAWYDAAGGEILRGGQSLLRQVTIDENPYFILGGSVIPLYPASVKNLASAPGDRYELLVAPGADSGEGRLYEDDGRTADYDRNCAFTTFAMNRRGNRLELVVSPRSGAFDGMPAQREWTVTLPNCLPPVRVTVDGREVSWSYDATLPGPRASTGPTDPSRPCTVVFTFDGDIAEGERLLAGKRAQILRTRKLAEELKKEVERVFPMASPTDEWLAISSFASQLAARPDQARAIVAAYDAARKGFLSAFDPIARKLDPKLTARIKAWLFADGNALSASDPTLRPVALKADGTDGANVSTMPALSWSLSGTGPTQKSYRIKVFAADGKLQWDSYEVTSSLHGGIPYRGVPLTPGATYDWEVKVSDGVCFSAPARARFTVGETSGEPPFAGLDTQDEGFALVKKIYGQWRSRGDAAVVVSAWPRLTRLEVFTREGQTLFEMARRIRAGWLMKEMGGEVSWAEANRYVAFEGESRKRFASLFQQADAKLRPEFRTPENLLAGLLSRVFKAWPLRDEARLEIWRQIRASGLPDPSTLLEPEELFNLLHEGTYRADDVWELVLKGADEPVYARAIRDWRVEQGAGIVQYWSSVGCAELSLRPVFTTRIDGLDETLETLSGPVRSTWRWTDEGKVDWTVELPAGVSASVDMNGCEHLLLGPGRTKVETRVTRQNVKGL